MIPWLAEEVIPWLAVAAALVVLAVAIHDRWVIVQAARRWLKRHTHTGD